MSRRRRPATPFRGENRGLRNVGLRHLLCLNFRYGIGGSRGRSRARRERTLAGTNHDRDRRRSSAVSRGPAAGDRLHHAAARAYRGRTASRTLNGTLRPRTRRRSDPARPVDARRSGLFGTDLAAGAASRRAGGHRLRHRRGDGDPPRHGVRRLRLHPEIPRHRQHRHGDPGRPCRRHLDAAGRRPLRRRGQGNRRPRPPPRDPDAAAGPRPDDAVRGPAQQADRLRARRLRGDREGPRLGDPRQARRRQPHPGGDRRRARSA